MVVILTPIVLMVVGIPGFELPKGQRKMIDSKGAGWEKYILSSREGRFHIVHPYLIEYFQMSHLAVLDPEEKSLNGLFSLLNM